MGVLVAVLIALPIALRAQSIQIHAPKAYEVDRPFAVTFIINTTAEVEILSEPSFSGLELLYGPAIGRSHSTSIVNGHATSRSQSEITYTLSANREGKYAISGLRVSIDGKELTAPGHTIQISGAGGNAGASHSSVSPNATRGEGVAQYKYQAYVPRRVVYVQEALPIVYKLQATEYPRFEDVKPSVYDGFVSLDLLGSNQRNIQVERIGGKDWATIDLMKELLFAQHAGTLTIPSNELSVLQTYKDPGGYPFLNQTVVRRLATEPIQIKVKPLPDAGKPTDFSGAVGSFTARYELSSNEWKTNEASKLKLVLEGQGNLKIAKLPKINLPNDIEVYDPVEKSEQKYENGVLYSLRVIEYNLIPRNIGNLTIPSVTLSYFDPIKAQYQSTSTKALQIKISQGRVIADPTTIISVKQAGDEHTPYGLIRVLTEGNAYKFNSIKLLLGYLLLSCIAVVLYRILRRRNKAKADTMGYAATRANSLAVKRLKKAHKLMQDNRKEAFLEELLHALWGYLGDKLRLPVSTLSRDNVKTHLEALGLADGDIIRLIDTIDAIEFARFAPASDTTPWTALYEQTIQAISSVETSQSKK